MLKQLKHIEIVCATEPGLSSMSPPSRKAISDTLSKHYSKVGISIVNNLSDLRALIALRPDLVFLGMKFIPTDPTLGHLDPNKIWITEYLDEENIAYTGSNQLAHNLELHKHLAKQRVLDAGLASSAFSVANQNTLLVQEDIKLRFPVFIKPTSRGGGLGIDSSSVAYNFAQLRSKVKSLFVDLGSDSLIEEYLTGREFSVAILKDINSSDYSVMPLELVAPVDERGARLLSAEVKSADTESFLEVTDTSIKAKISTLAINVFHALGARDYGRIDIRLDQYGTPHFLEANLLPSLINGYGNFPKACLLNIGLGYEPMILDIVELALYRSNKSIDVERSCKACNLSLPDLLIA